MKTLVVKIGSSVLTLESGAPDHKRFESFAQDIAHVMDRGYAVVVVSSGAIAFGRGIAGARLVPVGIAEKQVLSSIGQPLLIHAYMHNFNPYNRIVSQVLLTHEDFMDRQRYLNARRSMELMLERGFVPIVNENDAIAVDEIKVGDNDTLSAMVAAMINAVKLIILSNVDAIYDRDPNKYQNAKPLHEISYADQHKNIDSTKSRYGVGGIKTKLTAARQLARLGISTTIVNGRTQGIVSSLVDHMEKKTGLLPGTTIIAGTKRVNGAKRWVGLLLKSSGSIAIDKGALSALLVDKSLLAAGVTRATGAFQEGDVVDITDEKGRKIGRGITNYTAGEIESIKGMKSSQIKSALGYFKGDEVVHRDNLMLDVGNQL